MQLVNLKCVNHSSFTKIYKLIAIITLSIIGYVAPVYADDFIPDDISVSDTTNFMKDMEFDIQGGHLAWQDDRSGTLWVADVDPNTGAFNPINGMGTMVDLGLLPMSLTKNGPEWILGLPKAQVVYSKQLTAEPVTSVVKRAYLNRQGIWVTEDLPDTNSFYDPIGSKNPTDINGQVASHSALSTIWSVLNKVKKSGSLSTPPYLIHFPLIE